MKKIKISSKDKIKVFEQEIERLSMFESNFKIMQHYMPNLYSRFLQNKRYILLSDMFVDFIKHLPKYEGTGQNPKIIWWCWLQGYDNAPPICKACLNSLIRNFPDDYNIIIVTNENRHDFVQMPDFIEDKYAKGFITNTHFSDILRTYLLVEYGGIWIDSTVLFTGANSMQTGGQ